MAVKAEADAQSQTVWAVCLTSWSNLICFTQCFMVKIFLFEIICCSCFIILQFWLCFTYVYCLQMEWSHVSSRPAPEIGKRITALEKDKRLAWKIHLVLISLSQQLRKNMTQAGWCSAYFGSMRSKWHGAIKMRTVGSSESAHSQPWLFNIIIPSSWEEEFHILCRAGTQKEGGKNSTHWPRVLGTYRKDDPGWGTRRNRNFKIKAKTLEIGTSNKQG